ncbi:MAG: hypothetical protein A4E73_00389 [Syntrophaceae bacterium PtaU1.Bin231]|nr:MAG: hypothetical protein A4E73_00389 [Syntrophaceae bacterium PtaU1.Bin231]
MFVDFVVSARVRIQRLFTRPESPSLRRMRSCGQPQLRVRDQVPRRRECRQGLPHGRRVLCLLHASVMEDEHAVRAARSGGAQGFGKLAGIGIRRLHDGPNGAGGRLPEVGRRLLHPGRRLAAHAVVDHRREHVRELGKKGRVLPQPVGHVPVPFAFCPRDDEEAEKRAVIPAFLPVIPAKAGIQSLSCHFRFLFCHSRGSGNPVSWVFACRTLCVIRALGPRVREDDRRFFVFIIPALHPVIPASHLVIPAEAGIQRLWVFSRRWCVARALDPRFRGGDRVRCGGDRRRCGGDRLATAGRSRDCCVDLRAPRNDSRLHRPLRLPHERGDLALLPLHPFVGAILRDPGRGRRIEGAPVGDADLRIRQELRQATGAVAGIRKVRGRLFPEAGIADVVEEDPVDLRSEALQDRFDPADAVPAPAGVGGAHPFLALVLRRRAEQTAVGLDGPRVRVFLPAAAAAEDVQGDEDAEAELPVMPDGIAVGGNENGIRAGIAQRRGRGGPFLRRRGRDAVQADERFRRRSRRKEEQAATEHERSQSLHGSASGGSIRTDAGTEQPIFPDQPDV